MIDFKKVFTLDGYLKLAAIWLTIHSGVSAVNNKMGIAVWAVLTAILLVLIRIAMYLEPKE